MVRALAVFATMFAAACGSASEAPSPAAVAPPRLDQVWRITGLASPESTALSSDGSFLYVSNVNGEGDARDGNGFISRVSLSGEIIEREWARGLNGPKGMMQGGDALYVSDIDRLVVIDAATGATRRTVSAPGAQFLNDLTFAPSGEVLIADSGGARIYAIASDTAEVWLENALLDSINGLLPEPERLLVATMQGRLLAIDYESRAIHVLAEGLGEADGIAALGDGRYLVTAWPGEMFLVDAAAGTHQRILDTRTEGRFLNDILLTGETLYVPHWQPGELTAYRLVR